MPTFTIVPNSHRRPCEAAGAPAAHPVPVDVTLAPHVTYAHAPALAGALNARLRTSPRFVSVGCDAVRRMDGAGVATLLEFAMACRGAGVRLLLVRPSAAVCNAFALYNLAHVVRELAYEPPVDKEDFEEGGLLIIIEDEIEESIRLPAVRLAG